jgi:hypothetical protein
MLQSEAGYIDARPHHQDRPNLLHRTAGPYIGVTNRSTCRDHFSSASRERTPPGDGSMALLEMAQAVGMVSQMEGAMLERRSREVGRLVILSTRKGARPTSFEQRGMVERAEASARDARADAAVLAMRLCVVPTFWRLGVRSRG